MTSCPVGRVCLGCPEAGIPGCGQPRLEAPLLVDPRLRWCCTWCAEKAAIVLGIVSPRQMPLI